MLAVDAAHLPVPSLVEFFRSATTATASLSLCHRRAVMGKALTSRSSPLSTTSGVEASSVLTLSSRSDNRAERSTVVTSVSSEHLLPLATRRERYWLSCAYDRWRDRPYGSAASVAGGEDHG